MTLDEHLEEALAELSWGICHNQTNALATFKVVEKHLEAARTIIAKGEIRNEWTEPAFYKDEGLLRRVLVIPLEGERSELDEEAPE